MKILLLMCVLFLICSCGEEGGKEEPKKIDLIENPTGINAITVDSEFDFTTDLKVKIEVLQNVVNKKAFLNICKKETILINNDNCFLRTPINENGMSTEITIPHKEQELKAEIWYYNVFSEPLIYEWNLDENKKEQTWVLNIKNK